MKKAYLYILGVIVFTASTSAAGVLFWRYWQAGEVTGRLWMLLAAGLVYGLLMGNVLYHYPGMMRRFRESRDVQEIGPEFYEQLNEYRARGRAELVAALRREEAR